VRIVSTDPDQPGIFAFGQVAVGIIAVGQLALGVVAIGQLARGFACIGQGAIGVFAIGQGAIGLWHGTGMIALAGQSGYGGSLHTIPQIVREAQPELADPTPLADLLAGRAKEGWIPAKIGDSGALTPIERDHPIQTNAIDARLADAQTKFDRAHVKVRANVVPDPAGYRTSQQHVELVASDAVFYSSNPRTYLAYGKIGKGTPGEQAGPVGLVLRTIVWIGMLAAVSLLTFQPLAEAFLK